MVKQPTPDSCLYSIPPGRATILAGVPHGATRAGFNIQFCPILGYDHEILLVVLSVFLTLSYHLPSPEDVGS